MARYGFNGKIWLDIQRRFRPCGKREYLEKLYNEAQGSVIKVPSMQEDNDFEYRFVGCQSFEEFSLAVFYVFSIDNGKIRRGFMSCCARDYIPCYRHEQYQYIKDYFERRRRSRELREGANNDNPLDTA